MKPILVVMHIYYSELSAELINCLKNIAVPYDLYVTTVEKNKRIVKDIFNFNKNAHFEVVENKGFDVGPFLHVLNKVNLNHYRYVVKLHTKRNMPIGAMCHYYDMSKDKWRKYAQEFIKTKNNFKAVLRALENNPKIGMIDNYHLIAGKETDEAAQKAVALLKKCEIEAKRFGYVAGTQFIVRANILKPLKKLNLKMADFELSDSTHQQVGLAHVMERVFGCLVLNQGYEIKDILNKKPIFDCLFFRKLLFFVYRKKVTKNNVLLIKIFKIILWRKKL